MLLALDKAQAQTVLGYIRSYFEDIGALAAMVQHETAFGFELNNQVDITIATNDFRSIRGRTVLCAVWMKFLFGKAKRRQRPMWKRFRSLRPGMVTPFCRVDAHRHHERLSPNRSRVRRMGEILANRAMTCW